MSWKCAIPSEERGAKPGSGPRGEGRLSSSHAVGRQQAQAAGGHRAAGGLARRAPGRAVIRRAALVMFGVPHWQVDTMLLADWHMLGLSKPWQTLPPCLLRHPCKLHA